MAARFLAFKTPSRLLRPSRAGGAPWAATGVVVVAGVLALAAGCGSRGNPISHAAVLLNPTSMDDVRRVVRERYPEVRQVSTSDLARAIDSGHVPVLLDARTPAEFAVSRLPGAIRVDPDAPPVPQLARLGIAKDANVVVYCSVGYRSSGFAERLREFGYTGVANLDGSIFQWSNEGRPLVSDAGPARLVHPYSAKWGKLLDPSRRARLSPP